MRLLFVLLSLLLSKSTLSQQFIEMDLKSHFDNYGVEGCFILFNETGNTYLRYNSGLCDSGYIPASTFKIPNSLIALEERVISDTAQVFKWDGEQWPNSSWNHDQTLRSAIRYSCVWVFVKIAEQTGIEKYYKYVNAFNYGNKDLTGPPTRFWLAGLFRISARQQVDFLRKFYNYELPVSHRSVDIVKDMIVLEETGSYRLSGKTGGAMINNGEYIMWLVGYVERGSKKYFYAMNFISDDFGKTSQARYGITKSILREIELID